MIIKELSCKNFIKFKEPQKLTFSHGKKHVTLIHGDGKAGKSSIYRALRWVLYGTTGDELEYKEDHQLINNINKDEGIFDMEVTLEFEANDSNYLVQRGVKLQKGKKIYSKPTDLEDYFYVEKDGEQEENPRKAIKEILDEDLSDFFIFDGEKLQDYKDLIYANSNNRSLLKSKIEKAMRLPHLVQAIKDLEVLKRNIDKERDKAIGDAELKTMADALVSLAELIETYKNEQTRLASKIREQQTLKESLEEERNSFGDKNEKVEKLNILKGRIPEMKISVNLLEKDLKKSTRDGFAVITDLIRQKYRKTFSNKTREQIEEKNRIDGLKAELKKMIEGETSGICPFCNNALSKDEKKLLKEKIKELKKEIASSNPPEDNSQITLVSEDIESLKKLTKDLKNARSEYANAKVDLENLEKEVGSEKGELGDIQEKIYEANEELEKLNYSYEEIERELKGGEDLKKKGNLYDDEGAERYYEKLEEKIDINRPDDDLKNKAELVSNLQNAFQEIKEEIEKKVKEDVELRANELYESMTEKKDLANILQVDESYGLKLIDPFGNEIPTSGTGNAIVAYSLLIALKDATSMKAPFVIDTPLGRVSPNYRKLILETIPKCTDQLVLLVHDGELKRGSDLHNVVSAKEGRSMKLNYKHDFETTVERI